MRDSEETLPPTGPASPITPPIGDEETLPPSSAPGELDTLAASAARRDWSMATPARIGRFAVLRKLGQGGMGVVYSAFDEELDRRVAIKVLLGTAHPEAVERMRREAQAMAKLSHPNVAQIHEVGTVDGHLFLAIEFVSGRTLGEWLATEEPRAVTEIVEVFTQAGRGLAAAHAAGLVHRDFKPDNAIIGDEDRRVRVLDFGLARKSGDAEPRPQTIDPDARGLEATLTQTGAMMGTPAYMSPEQARGEGTDPRTDQFSFCVALFEALHGARPFQGDSLAELITNITEGRMAEVPSRRAIPPHVRHAVERGLSIDPQARFDDMDALLTALDTNRVGARRSIALGAGVVAALTLAGYSLGQREAERPPPCQFGPAEMSPVWDSARASSLAAAFEASGSPYATGIATQVQRQIDRRRDDWVTAKVEACMATERGEQSPELLDRRMACLDDRRAELDALVTVLESADADVVERASDGIAALAAVDLCADAERLLAVVEPPPPELEARVDAAEDELREIDALKFVARFEDGRAKAERLLGSLSEVAYPPIVGAAALRVAQLTHRAGKHAEAEAPLRRSLVEAVASGDEELELAARLELGWLVGYRLGRADEGLFELDLAEAALRRLGRSEGPHASEVETNRSAIYGQKGELERALDSSRRALEIELARDPESAEVGTGYVNLGENLRSAGRYADATEPLERGLALFQRHYGDEHPNTLHTKNLLAGNIQRQGDPERAVGIYRETLAAYERHLGEDHPSLAGSLNGLGGTLTILERYDEALGYQLRAVALLERTLGADHINSAIMQSNLGNTYFRLGRFDEATAAQRRALVGLEAKLGKDNPLLGQVHASLAQAHLGADEPQAALDAIERGLTLLGDEGEPLVTGPARTVEAKALWAATKNRARTLDALDKARAEFARAGAGGDKGLADLERWAREQGLPDQNLPDRG